MATETLVRDRDGTLEIDADWEHDPRCDGMGWAGSDADDAPRPCLDCRPWLRPGSRVQAPSRARRRRRA